MIDKMYWACAGALSLATQIGLAHALPPADELQRRISGMFEQMARRCREVGIPQEDFEEARYAIAAFMDEQVLRTDWPGRNQWIARPLQFLYFNENTAGEGFFAHLQALQSQAATRAHVLEIYYLCLELGFQGKYAVRGGEGMGPLIAQVGGEVSRALPPSEVLSPHGESRDAVRSLVQQEKPIVAVALGIFGFAFILFLGMKLLLVFSTSATTARMTKTTTVNAAQQPVKP